MKKNIAILFSLLTMGCSKDYLDKQPQAQILVSNFYQTEANAIAAVNAAYDPMQWNQTGGTGVYNPEFFFGDIVSDDALKGGENDGDIADLQDMVLFNGQASSPSLAGLWSALYQGVYRSNLVILNVPTITMSVPLRNRIVGEAKFLRAYYYFYLVRMWGDVPLILKPLAPSEYKQPKVAKSLVFAQIEKDLAEAAEVLPDNYSAGDVGRATKGAANSFLVKAYVFQSNWAKAEPLALSVINSGVYALDSVYKDIFSMGHENSTESIFEIQHSTLGPDWGNGNEGNLFSVMQGGRNSGWGWGFNCPTQNFVNEFEAGDPRLAATVIFDKDTVNSGIADNSDSPTKMRARKYTLLTGERPTTGDAQSNSPKNRRVLRYADLLLMYAEAAYQNGNETGALDKLELVRARARKGAPAGTLPLRVSTGNQLLQDIYHERRVELGLEGIRFFDIVRQGRAAQIMNSTAVQNDKPGSTFKTGTNEVFPLPQSEIDLSGGVLKQNNGY